MTTKKRLQLVNTLLESDTALNASSQGGTKKEFAVLIERLYRLVHPAFCSAPHKDWEEDNKTL